MASPADRLALPAAAAHLPSMEADTHCLCLLAHEPWSQMTVVEDCATGEGEITAVSAAAAALPDLADLWTEEAGLSVPDLTAKPVGTLPYWADSDKRQQTHRDDSGGMRSHGRHRDNGRTRGGGNPEWRGRGGEGEFRGRGRRHGGGGGGSPGTGHRPAPTHASSSGHAVSTAVAAAPTDAAALRSGAGAPGAAWSSSGPTAQAWGTPPSGVPGTGGGASQSWGSAPAPAAAASVTSAPAPARQLTGYAGAVMRGTTRAPAPAPAPAPARSSVDEAAPPSGDVSVAPTPGNAAAALT